jgi:hypothetical protein
MDHHRDSDFLQAWSDKDGENFRKAEEDDGIS